MCRLFYLYAAAYCILLASCNAKNYVLVGSYTNNNSNGISVYGFDKKNGILMPVSHTENINDPSYLAISKNKKNIYAVNEGKGTVSAFSFNKKSGTLHLLNRQTSEGAAPCYVSIDASGKFLAIANYTGGNFVVFPLNNKGEILPSVQNIPLSSTGTGKSSHAHAVVFSADNKYLFVTDLGNNKLYQYRFSSTNTLPVQENPRIYSLPESYGPRHIAIDNRNNILYVLNEWEGNISVFKKENDLYKNVQNIVSANVSAPDNKNKGSAAIKISPDGNFLYTSNRGVANNIAIFKVNKDGSLTKTGEQNTGRHPRDFMIDRSGNFLLVAARDDNTITIYKRSSATGMLTATTRKTTVSMPVMLLEY